MKEHSKFIDDFLSLIYPSFCISCGKRTDNPYPLCEDCTYNIKEVDFPYCRFCGKPLELINSKAMICGDCIKKKPSFVMARSGYIYEGLAKRIVHAWKYEKKRAFSKLIGRLSLKNLLKSEIPISIIDAITFVPLSKSNKRKRGFNQAEDIALFLSRKFHIPIYRGIRKKEKIKEQAALSRVERLKNVKDAFYIEESLPADIKNLLIIDDVYTTGATLKEITRILLLHNQVLNIYVYTFTRGVM